MANTTERRRKTNKVKEDRHKHRQALKKMTNTAGVVNTFIVNTLSDRNLYQIPYAHIHEMSIGDMERMNKKWLKKIKPKKRMTKKEYRLWKSKMKRLGVA